MRLSAAAGAWQTPGFDDVLKREIERLPIGELPLQQALQFGNRVIDAQPTAMIHAVEERDGLIVARVGLFFSGIDTGSCCANDPTPVEPHQEYCVVRFEIESATGETRLQLLDS